MAHSTSPAVSVIIPTHNRSAIISQTIDSVLAQSFTDFEIIVVDDGSTDNTASVLQEQYAQKLTYIRIENSGLPAARNTGIKAARGTYVAFIDDDDLWLPDKLQRQMTLMQNNPSLGLVYCGCYKIGADGAVLSETRPAHRGALLEYLLRSNCIVGSASAVLVTHEVFSRAGYFDETLKACEDWDMWIRIARYYQIDFIDEPLVRLRIDPHSMQHNMRVMEQATFSVLNKYWTERAPDLAWRDRKNEVYSTHCINFAWKYYDREDRQSFNRLLYQALEYYPLNKIYIHGEGTAAKEKAVFEVFHSFWDSHQQLKDSRKKAFAVQYQQFAWEYYHQGDVRNFRRCVGRIFRASFLKIPLRLSIPYLKSFLGKPVSEKIHAARQKYF